MTVMNLDKLEVWARAKNFALAVYREVIPDLLPDEKWYLTQQLKRAAQSIPANIAEGHGRYHFPDNVRFCYIARGSLTEVQSHMAPAHELGYIMSLISSIIRKKTLPLNYDPLTILPHSKDTHDPLLLPARHHSMPDQFHSHFILISFIA